ncbi:MAG TPA: Mur ligase family protein, partial [Kofleriaceae bacterium]|nr:Mur ligase family protein [Kofleriaceae bacterium]
MTDLDAAYHQLLERLFSARRFGVVLGLERLRAVLAALGDPQRRLGALVHVAGTNGKGSTAAMIAAMVRAHGRTAALYTSPHLTSVRERIVFEGEPIGRAALLAAAARVAQAGGDSLTFFEQLTAMALVELAQRAPDVTILEVGLGGRLDATNVVDSDVAVVTGVALDHQAILGDTLEQIAREKAGIFRRGKPAVIGVSGEAAAVPALYAEALRLGAAPVEQLEEAAVAAVPPLSLRG